MECLVKPEVYDKLYQDEQVTKYQFLINAGIRFHGDILDVGCGTGLFFEYITKIRNVLRGKYVCLDPNPGMLYVALNRLKSHFSIIIEGYGEELPFRRDSFDIVVSISTWGALEKSKEVLEGFKEVLKGGGLVIISGHPRTFNILPSDLDHSFYYLGRCIDDFFIARKPC